MNIIILIIISTQFAVLVGSLCATFLISWWPTSTAEATVDLYYAILIIALPVVNLVVFLLFLPFQLSGKIDIRRNYVLWVVPLLGGSVYLLINIVIALFSGRDVLTQFFATKAFVFPFIIGVVFAGLFIGFYRIILCSVCVEKSKNS